jgi:hypothetical protein
MDEVDDDMDDPVIMLPTCKQFRDASTQTQVMTVEVEVQTNYNYVFKVYHIIIIIKLVFCV